MNRVLKNLYMLMLALAVSTCAALCLKGLARAASWAAHANLAARPLHTQRAPRLSDAPLLITYQPRPARTTEAINSNVTGVVKLNVLLLADGTVGDIRPVEVLPAKLTERACAAANNIKFRPAVVGGQFTDTWQTVEFEFDAENDLHATNELLPPNPD
ncbi:MAG TPA: energy transducer TonB [Pyrinomonadaceae bacterium]|jgi:hypothetical protein|nr:energy transducer TonB [Pyrinomonadaceae bacterium]